jgi:hypothetical protein
MEALPIDRCIGSNNSSIVTLTEVSTYMRRNTFAKSLTLTFEERSLTLTANVRSPTLTAKERSLALTSEGSSLEIAAEL